MFDEEKNMQGLPERHRGSRAAVKKFDWLQPFKPHPLYRGGWLQTASVKLLRPSLDVKAWPGMLPFEVEDAENPPDRLTGYYLPAQDPETSQPTAVVFHGIGGDAKSTYVRSLAASLLSAGYPVVLWNHRGAGSSGRTCRGLHHPGACQDIEALIRYLEEQRPQWMRFGLTAAAFSLGANRTLHFLAQTGIDSPFSAAVMISPPLDLKMTSRKLGQGWNKPFDRFLLHRQHDELLRPGSEASDKEREVIRSTCNIWELDDRFTSPHFGYAGVEDYYEAASAIDVLDQIRTPTLFFHALDDPVVDDSVFAQRQWQADGPLFPALAHSGGHAGFLEWGGHGGTSGTLFAFSKIFSTPPDFVLGPPFLADTLLR